jgi:hypothetical protein
MNKILVALILLVVSVTGICQNGALRLVVPHPFFMKPNHYLINGDYGISCRYDAYKEERVYCLYDLKKKQLIHSESNATFEIPALAFLDNEPTGDYYLDRYLTANERPTFLKSDGFADTLRITDRNNKLVFSQASGEMYIEDKQQRLIPFSSPGFKLIFDAGEEICISISPDASHIAISGQDKIHVFDVAAGNLIWVSERLENTRYGFSLMVNQTIVVPQLHASQKYKHLYWYNYGTNTIEYSSEMSMNASLLYEYQAYDHLMILLGSPESKKPVSSFYIDLRTGFFSDQTNHQKQDPNHLAFYMRDSIVAPKLSPTVYADYFENYTIYPGWLYYLNEFYTVDEDLKEITKRKLTPVTADVEFFYENGYFNDDYVRYQIISTYRNRITYKEITDDIAYYQIIRLKKEILFWNGLNPEGERNVSLVVTPDGNPIFITPDNYFFAPKEKLSYLSFDVNGTIYSFEQFDLKYNRPDIILDRLGYADETLISAYYQAYKKRLSKMGFTEEMLKDDFNLPEIKIEDVDHIPSSTDESSINLRLNCEDDMYPLDRINIWLNDVAIYGENGISVRKENVSSLDTLLTINLARGKNKIQVAVLNQAGAESYKETVEIECTAGKSGTDLYLVTIGASEFKDARYNLAYAAKDAQDVEALFVKSTFFENVYSTSMLNEEITLENVSRLKDFLANAGINDQVIIFVAGHGVLDADFNYYFASHDMDFQNPSARGIPYEAIEGLLDGIRPLKKLLFMDTCHSGEVDKEEIQLSENQSHSENDVVFRNVGVAIENKETQLGLQNTSELMRSMFTDLRKGTGSTVISSAGGVEFAMESDTWQNGLFTYCLINGLSTRAADLDHDKEITISELQVYVQSEVSKLSNGRQTPTSRIVNQQMDYRIW